MLHKIRLYAKKYAGVFADNQPNACQRMLQQALHLNFIVSTRYSIFILIINP